MAEVRIPGLLINSHVEQRRRATYWLSRYVERVENTARLVNVNSELMLDFPGDKSLGWQSIIGDS